MNYKVVFYLCFSIFSSSHQQIISSWRNPQNNFNSANSYNKNFYSGNQNTGNAPSYDQPSSNNKNAWETQSFSNNFQPSNQNIYNTNKKSNEGFGNDRTFGRDVDRSTTTNKQKPNSGNSESWQSNASSSNKKPNKMSPIINNPLIENSYQQNDQNLNSQNWYSGNTKETNSENTFSTFDNAINPIYSSWNEGNEKNSNSAFGSSEPNMQNSKKKKIFENNLESNYEKQPSSNDDFYDNSYNLETNSWNSNQKGNKNLPKKIKPTSNNNNNKNNNNNINGLNNNNNNNNINSYNNNNNNFNNNDNNNINNLNNIYGSGGSSSSNTNNNNINNKKNTTFGIRPTDQQSNKNPPSSVDLSILDELDKNDWYFGQESNYPNPPFKSNLNIDVSELWNFDKRNKNQNSNSNTNKFSNNKKIRRNRETNFLIPEVNCECVNVSFCDEDDILISLKDFNNDLRLLENSQCELLTEVCCRNPKIQEFSSNEENAEKPLSCGQWTPGNNLMELGEDVFQLEEFPWNLRLQNLNNDFICTGSLIHPKVALTSAHCVERLRPEYIKVMANTWNDPQQSQKVIKIIKHPGYSSVRPRNDIALLILENPFMLTENVNTICLPTTNDQWDAEECFLTTWVQRKINGEVLSFLKKEDIEFLPEYTCQAVTFDPNLWSSYVLHDSFICGREKNYEDLCLKNEGSAVVCPSTKSSNTYLQIGIVSNYENCNIPEQPKIFTNILKFIDWISENIFDLGLFDDIDIKNTFDEK